MSDDNNRPGEHDGNGHHGDRPTDREQQSGRNPSQQGRQGQGGGRPPQGPQGQGGGRPPQGPQGQGGGRPPQGRQGQGGYGQPRQQGHRRQQANTSSGLEEPVAAALSYLFGFVTGLLFYLLEDDNEYIRFHAMQSILLNFVFILGWVFISIFFGIFAELVPFGGLLGLFTPLFSLAGLVLVVFMMIKAYNGEWFELPVIGEIARDKAPPSPSQGRQPAGGRHGGGQHSGQGQRHRGGEGGQQHDGGRGPRQ